MTPEEARHTVLEKMKGDRPTLRAYLREHAALEARCSEQWKAVGHHTMAEFRNGMSQAYRDIERMLERDGFSPDEGGICEHEEWAIVTPGVDHQWCVVCGAIRFIVAGKLGRWRLPTRTEAQRGEGRGI